MAHALRPSCRVVSQGASSSEIAVSGTNLDLRSDLHPFFSFPAEIPIAFEVLERREILCFCGCLRLNIFFYQLLFRCAEDSQLSFSLQSLRIEIVDKVPRIPGDFGYHSKVQVAASRRSVAQPAPRYRRSQLCRVTVSLQKWRHGP